MGRPAYANHPNRRALLIEARERAGISRTELAERCGFGRWVVFRVEEGIRNPSHEAMIRWANELEIPLDFFRSTAQQPRQAAE